MGKQSYREEVVGGATPLITFLCSYRNVIDECEIVALLGVRLQDSAARPETLLIVTDTISL